MPVKQVALNRNNDRATETQGVSAFFDALALFPFRAAHIFFPTRVSRKGATTETSWPPAVMMLPPLFLYASTAERPD